MRALPILLAGMAGTAAAQTPGPTLSTLIGQGYEPFAVVALERRTDRDTWDTVVTEKVYLRAPQRFAACILTTPASSDRFRPICFAVPDP